MMLWWAWCKRSWPVRMSSTLSSLLLLFFQNKWHNKRSEKFSENCPFVTAFDGLMFLRRSTQIKTYSWDNAQVVLAGNKCDMDEERVVSVDSGRLLAEQLGKSWGCYVLHKNRETSLFSQGGKEQSAPPPSELQPSVAQEPKWGCWCVDCRCFDVSRRCSFQVLNSLKPAPKTTSTWSRPSNASSTSSATRCPRAWTAIQPSLPERPAPNSRTALRRSSSPGATVSDWWWRKAAGGQCCSCTAVQCTEFCSFSIITPAPAAFELQLKPSWVVDSLSCYL